MVSCFAALGAAFSVFIAFASAQASNCSTTLTPTNSVKPTVAAGYRMALVATGLTDPRSIEFDSAGNLLVAEAGSGITNLAFQDDGGTCLIVKTKKTVINASGLNHGLALSQDGKTIYASSSDAAFSWSYDPNTSTVGAENKTLVTGMFNEDHSTRTLLVPQKVNGTLLVSRGSNSNVDLMAESLDSGHSQIKAFTIDNVTSTGYDFSSNGLRLGWGLRNSVGIAEHPDTGGIYSVENSVDQIMREGKDVHQDNPGEEMNFHGFLNGTKYDPQGSNYGYPFCFAAWAPLDLPQNQNLTVGSNFAMGDQNNTVNDTFCAERTPPRLTFQAHMAPLDLKFNDSATEAWISFHGSWDRSDPVGYKVSMLPFQNGEPVAKSNNNTAIKDIFGNADNSVCPDNCFRPVGLAFDSRGRLFVSSDATGEIYVIERDSTSSAPTNTASSHQPTSTSGAETPWSLSLAVLLSGVIALFMTF